VFDSRRYQILWEVMSLNRGPLSLVDITEELLECKNSGLRSRKSILTAMGSVALTTRHPLSAEVGTNFSKRRRSVGIVRLRTKATELSLFRLVSKCSEIAELLSDLQLLIQL
jgi:hypothetical protein